MNNFPKDEYLKEVMRKTIVQQEQFDQWLRYLFYINNELINSLEFVHQDMFYVKFHEVYTIGIKYVQNNCLKYLKKNEANNNKKIIWYNEFISGINDIISCLSEEEISYIEYRRHNVCHIFQNGYEHIQDGNLSIKKKKGDKDLKIVRENLKKIMKENKNDRNIDILLNSKIQPKLKLLYERLLSI